MRIKSYFAQSVQEAMQKARFELGPEALLLDSKRAVQPGVAGVYEVTFGISQDAHPEPPAPSESRAVLDPGIAQQLAELRQQIETVQQSLKARPQPISNGARECDGGLAEALSAAGFSFGLAHELVESARLRALPGEPAVVAAQPAPPRRGRPRGTTTRKRSAKANGDETAGCTPELLLDEIVARFSVAPGLGMPGHDHKPVLLVGPPGAGKTTTLVKLAIAYGITRKIPVQIVSTDTLRLGGAEQLQAYSRIVGASFHAVHGRKMLEDALAAFPTNKLVLIDTPGFGPADLDEAAELCGFVRHSRNIDVHLVLPATLHIPALASALQRFGIFKPSKLIFTHMDEMDTPGCLLETAIQSGLPISFLANGQQIPEDLAEASKSELRLRVSARLEPAACVAA